MLICFTSAEEEGTSKPDLIRPIAVNPDTQIDVEVRVKEEERKWLHLIG